MGRDRDRRGGGGALGKLIGVVGHGVGMAAEYHEHRKQKKEQMSQHSSQHGEQPTAGPSSRPEPFGHASRGTGYDQSPPAYSETAESHSERSLAQGGHRYGDDKKMAHAQYDDDDDDSSSEDDLDRDLIENDEEDWALDDAQPPSYDESERPARSTEELVRDVLSINPSSRTRTQRQPLPFPVIIPQRRPGNKGRGFIHAYAPVLNDCGIDQETFLTFLKTFHESSKASPIFPMIQIASGIAGLAPSVIAMAVTTVVSAGAGIGAELQARTRTNTFLDRMNQELFQPAGLYAMIMKYKPEAIEDPAAGGRLGALFQTQKVDLSTNQMIAKYGRDLVDGNRNGRGQNFRMGNGTSRGALALPECAPLVFPVIDDAIVSNGSKETFKDKTKDFGSFLAGYMDRRAQMKYAAEDPNSALVVPVSERKSQAAWADPNHPMYKGGLVGLVTGGAVQRGGRGGRDRGTRDRRDRNRRDRPRRRQRDGNSSGIDQRQRELELYQERDLEIQQYEREMNAGRQLDDQTYSRYERLLADREWRQANQMQQQQGQQGRGKKKGGIKRLMKQDVMYLLIVNLPSEAELAEAYEQLHQPSR